MKFRSRGRSWTFAKEIREGRGADEVIFRAALRTAVSTVAEFTVPASDFPLGHVFEEFPDVTVEIEQVVPTNHAVLPYFWVRNEPVENVREALEERGERFSYALVDDLGDQGLFRAEWDSEAEGVLTGIIESELTLLSATGTEDEWAFEFRAEDTDRIAEFQQYCAGHDIAIELARLHSIGSGDVGGQYSLTSDQREAVLLAYESGYYESPPETNLGELAEELGINRSSFSDRLRRGVRNLVEDTLDIS